MVVASMVEMGWWWGNNSDIGEENNDNSDSDDGGSKDRSNWFNRLLPTSNGVICQNKGNFTFQRKKPLIIPYCKKACV